MLAAKEKRAEFERQSELNDKKFASNQKLEEARLALDVARQRISAAQEELTRIEAALAGDPKIRTDDHPRVRQMMATPKLPVTLLSQFSKSKIGRMNHSNQPQSIALDSCSMPASS